MKPFVPVLNAADVHEIDAYNASLGMPASVLMQTFATAIADDLAQCAPRARRFVVLVGPGNNGGDGWALARVLVSRGSLVTVVAPYGMPSAEPARLFADAAVRDGIAAIPTADARFSYADVIVDALFGVGLTRPIEGAAADAIACANAAPVFRVAVDVPSGLADDGQALGAAVFRADRTVTACGVKRALLFRDGRAYAGELAVKDILACLPRADYPEFVADCPPSRRPRVCHKGDFASVWVIAGSASCVGAGLLAFEAAHAALRAGAGLVRLVVRASDYAVYAARVREEMLVPVADDFAGVAERIPDGAVVLVGPGLGATPSVSALTERLLRERAVTLVLDADAINAFRAHALLPATRCSVLFTPHVGEFSRLSGLSVAEILRDPLAAATDWAGANACTLLLKSDFGIATDGRKTFVCACGTPAQAKGGSGDTLAGVVSALCGEFDPTHAAIYGFALCAKAARSRAAALGERALLASDAIGEIAAARKSSRGRKRR